MLSLAMPASLDDTIAAIAPHGKCHPMVWTVTRHQIALAPSYAIRDERGHALAIGGFWRAADYREAWTAYTPAAAARMGEVIRLTRLTLLEMAQSDAVPIVAYARTSAGSRISLLLGFTPLGDDVFIWEGFNERAGEGHLRRRRQSRGNAARRTE